MKTITRNTLLYKSGVEYADFCLNHVEGCSHGCRFPCYAMLMAKRFGKIKDYHDWTTPKLVSNALELLDKEIPRLKDKIKFVHLCFTTDPFMYGYPEVGKMTLKIIEKLNKNGIRCTVLTKGIYPKALADKARYGSDNEYGITLVSLDKHFKKEFEPYSAPYGKRVESLRYLHEHGLKTWISMEPYPTPNIIKQDLQELLHVVSFADKIVFGRLNYNSLSPRSVENDTFYSGCARIVTDFSEIMNIACHVKFGTHEEYDATTKRLFLQPDKIVLNVSS